LGPEKLLKICQDVEPFFIIGTGGLPPVSTWIIPPPLGRNGPYCIKFLHWIEKLLLNLTPDKPLALVKKLPYFDNPIELDVLQVGALNIGVHDLINFFLFNVFMVDLCRGQVLSHV
jgi:hypothetical protein